MSGESARPTPSGFQGRPEHHLVFLAGIVHCGGRLRNPAGTLVALVEHWNGEAWHPQLNGGEALRSNDGFGALSCLAESFCAAVGNKVEFYGYQIAAVRAETTMAIQSTPTPSGASHVLLSGSSARRPAHARPSARTTTARGR